MIGNNAMFLGKRGPQFTQLLSSLKYSPESLPIGMNDEVSGNDADFVDSYCFKGDESGYFQYGISGQSSLWEVQNFSVEFSIKDGYLLNNGIIATGLPTITGWHLLMTVSPGINFSYQATGGIESTFFENITTDITNLNNYKLSKYGSTLKLENLTEGTSEIRTLIDSTILYQGTSSFRRSVIANGGDNRLFNSGLLLGVRVVELNVSGDFVQNLANYPVCPFGISDPANYTEFDVSGNDNHATLINGSSANEGRSTRPDGVYAQLGYTISDGVNYYFDQALTQLIPSGVKIPALESDITKCVAYTTGGVRADLVVKSEVVKFLNDGSTKLKQPEAAELIASDIDNVYFDGAGNAKDTTFAEIENAITNNPTVYGGDVVSGESIKNISLK